MLLPSPSSDKWVILLMPLHVISWTRTVYCSCVLLRTASEMGWC